MVLQATRTLVTSVHCNDLLPAEDFFIMANGNNIISCSNPNPNLKWERKGELNIGVDFGIMKNRVSGSFDYYVRNTNNLLWTCNVPVPPKVYNQIYTDVGKMRNTGFEFTVNAKPV